MLFRNICWTLICLASTSAMIAGPNVIWAQATQVDRQKLETIVAKGINYLQTKGQAADGSFSRQIGVAVTAMATEALLRNGRTPADPMVAKALKVIEDSVQPDGGIYAPHGRLKTYETCIAVLCLTRANKDGKYDQLLKNADKFLRQVPIDGSESVEKDNFSFGGAGYGVGTAAKPGRADLSNTSYLIDALKAAGASPDDEAIKNALVFVSRCQNLETEHNTTPFAAKINDGGFYYTPMAGKESDEPMEAGGLRSYGSMSYAGLKSMVFAGLKENDPRVKAVMKWVAKHYTVKANPGMDDNGLYYYYLTFSKGLDAAGVNIVTDERDSKHDWRKDLVDELARRQQPDGSWVNTNRKWMEGDPNLGTAFALLALSYCNPQK